MQEDLSMSMAAGKGPDYVFRSEWGLIVKEP
jgi:hypothetical protein